MRLRSVSDRCTGHCCRDFHVGAHSYDELRRAYVARKLGRSDFERDDGTRMPHLADILTLFPMLIPNAEDRHYHCAHIRPDGDCAIYESRPQMCRDYPYGRRCTFAGCTWDEARNGVTGADAYWESFGMPTESPACDTLEESMARLKECCDQLDGEADMPKCTPPENGGPP